MKEAEVGWQEGGGGGGGGHWLYCIPHKGYLAFLEQQEQEKCNLSIVMCISWGHSSGSLVFISQFVYWMHFSLSDIAGLA